MLTAIETPRRQSELEGSARAAATLSGPGIVGVVTVGPARLGLLPVAGGEGRVIDIPVESPHEVALLSPELAVVRAGEGHLFGLFDLGGTVRARAVGRDARALCMRPSGDTAMVIHHDGSAGVITSSRSEISTRPINLRGTLRACDVGENVTYVVLEGEGGGLFRIHPGPTPELGTSAKTTLPAEAKDLDQVRGGSGLSVVWKRAFPSLCVVTGTPARLSARMVSLDARPAEVAVLDDALLVAFADGRLALYDLEALAAAGDAPLTPQSVVTLAARGKPRIALATTKGGPALWIGTTSGEVFRASLRREARAEKPEAVAAPPAPAPPAAPEPPPAPEPPREDPRDAELLAARQALADAETVAREAQEARTRSADEHAAALETIRATLEEEHAGRVDALKQEHAATLEESRAALEAEHAGRLETLKQEHAATLEESRLALEADHAGRFDALKQEHTAARETDRTALEAEHAGRVEALKQEHTTARESDRTTLEAEHTGRVEALEQEHTTARESDRTALEAEHAGRVEALKQEHATEREVERAALETEHAAHAQMLKQEHETSRVALEAAHAGQVDVLKAAALADKEAAEAKHAEAEATIRAVSEARDGALADLATARSEEAVSVGRARVAEARAEAAEERARVAEARADKDKRERIELEADLGQLRKDLTEQRAQLEKDVLKWGDRTISLEGARTTLDAMVARAQSVFTRRGGG